MLIMSNKLIELFQIVYLKTSDTKFHVKQLFTF